MGNLNDYGLPQMKRIVVDATNAKDAYYLPLLHQAVQDVDSKINEGMSVTVTGSSYALTPALVATSPLWNVIARRAVFLHRQYELQQFLKDFEGLASIRDDVTTMTRSETMRQLRRLLDDARSEYSKALSGYRRGDSDTVATMEQIALREDENAEVLTE